jgi:hypothetical protein
VSCRATKDASPGIGPCRMSCNTVDVPTAVIVKPHDGAWRATRAARLDAALRPMHLRSTRLVVFPAKVSLSILARGGCVVGRPGKDQK